MLLCQFPTLQLVVIHKVIVFYLENQEAVDAYVAEYLADRPSPSERAARPQPGRDAGRLEARQQAVTVNADRV